MAKTVVVGMSGGVDSSISAILLKEQGYHVIGLFMKNWEEKKEDGSCMSAQDYEDVLAVCNQIGIRCYSVNFSTTYWDEVFEFFLAELKAGRTPNPDILCNREIKFKVFLDKAISLGADYLATGHYCRIQQTEGEYRLLKGRDPNKDQSYFLYTLTSDILKKVLFPVGDLEKTQVRELAEKYQLVNASKKDSTGICFIGKRDFKSFVSQYIAYHPGNLVSLEGKVLGKHEGAAYYTIGQRHGLGIGGQGEAWFVAGKNMEKNEVIVVQGADHPALFANRLTAYDPTWISSKEIPLHVPQKCSAKIRYRQVEQPCTFILTDHKNMIVEFDTPQRAVTPGQSIVFYQGEVCLGGAVIAS